MTIVLKNAFNKKVIENLEITEHNLLLGLLGRLKEKGLAEVCVTFEEASVLIGGANTRPFYVDSIGLSLWDKVKMTDYTLYSNSPSGLKPRGGVMLFSYFDIDKDQELIKIKINPDLAYFVNRFEDGNFTSIKFKHFQDVENKYGKRLFKLLSQYKRTGFFVADKEDFFYLMGKPESYDIKTFHKRVLDPAIDSVRPFFNNLSLVKIKTGRSISHYEFHFTRQTGEFIYDPGFASSPKFLTNKQKEESDYIVEEFTEVVDSENNYANNFKNDYLPGKNSPTKVFKAWLAEVNLFKDNDEYFEMRSKSRTDLMSIYKSKVIDADSKYWTDMRFFAAAYSVVKSNKAMTNWHIEDAYAEIRGGKRLDIPQEIYSSLPEDKGNQLQAFALKGEII